MLNNLRTISNRMGGDDDGGASVEALEPILREEETVRFLLQSSKGMEHTTDGRSTTVEPTDGHKAYAIVTDFRVLFLVGSDAEEPSVDIEVDLGSVRLVQAKEGLLSSTLIVSEPDTKVEFVPSDGPPLSEVADYIERIGEAWADLEESLEATREGMDLFRDRLRDGGDAHDALTRARSRLSNAQYHATKHDDAPVEQMQGRLGAVEADLAELPVAARLDVVEDQLSAARSTDSLVEAVDALNEAADSLAEARTARQQADEVADDASDERLTAVSDELDELAGAILDDAEADCHSALAAEDPAEAAEHWARATDQYRAMIEAGWDGPAGVGEQALRYQLAWVVGGRIDALARRAGAIEAAADDLGDDDDEATDRYERALSVLETARDLADEHPHADADRLADRIADLEEKKEVSEWQWGDA